VLHIKLLHFSLAIAMGFRLPLEFPVSSSVITYRVINCLENLEMSGNDTGVRDMSGISLKVMEMSGNCQGKKSCYGKLCDFYNFPL